LDDTLGQPLGPLCVPRLSRVQLWDNNKHNFQFKRWMYATNGSRRSLS